MDAGDSSKQILETIACWIGEERSPAQEIVQQIFALSVNYRSHLIGQYLLQQTGAVVQSGPFAGMKYVARSLGSALPPKLLGCYEAELHGVLGQIAKVRYGDVINVGCGEGYYAVGLARLLPSAQVHAFDTNPTAQILCRELAALNGVAGRVHVAGECRHDELRRLIRGRTLIVCDCEGTELSLLDPTQVPELRMADLLVELHQFLDRWIPFLIETRFAPTHAVTRVEHAGRNPYEFRVLENLCQMDQYLAVWEERPGPTPWVFFVADERETKVSGQP